MPIGLVINLCLIVGFIGWWIGGARGYKLGSTYTDKYWHEARRWERKYFDLLMGLRPPDKPDDDRPDDEEDEQTVMVREPVKAIAKAAGAGR